MLLALEILHQHHLAKEIMAALGLLLAVLMAAGVVVAQAQLVRLVLVLAAVQVVRARHLASQEFLLLMLAEAAAEIILVHALLEVLAVVGLVALGLPLQVLELLELLIQVVVAAVLAMMVITLMPLVTAALVS
jgi:hypothetical protein